MIKEVSGDILLSDAEVMAHGVAPNDHFDQGLALALRERWPGMFRDFRHHCHNSHPKAGTIWSWGGPDHARIIALLTQEAAYDTGSKPGKAKIKHVNHCLKHLRQTIESEGYKSVALPKLSTGVGGLDWEEVFPLIQQHMEGLDARVYVYSEYHAGVKAKES